MHSEKPKAMPGAKTAFAARRNTPSTDFLWFLKAPLGPLPCPPCRNEHERLAAFAAYQSVLWMLADERVHGTEYGDMLRVGRGRPRIGFDLDV
jgi:hypothetical protein